MNRNTRGADPETCLLHAMQVAGQLRRTGPSPCCVMGLFLAGKFTGPNLGATKAKSGSILLAVRQIWQRLRAQALAPMPQALSLR